jgi:alpha-1,3-rhamnosyltransferase
MNPLVSIIIPSYNHSKYITETIESILGQTYDNFELIVIDDGSQDNSIEIIEKLRLNNKFIFIKRENKGLCETLNEGINLSRGKYIAICASDDIYLKDKIKLQVDFLETNPNYALCYGKIISFDNDGNQKFINSKKYKSGKLFLDLIKTNFVPAVTQMYRKDIFDNIGGFDKDLWIEDWDMLLRISYSYEIGFLDKYLAMYRNHGENMSGGKNIRKMYENELKILNKWKDTEAYSKVINFWEEKWFSELSRIDKEEARKYLFSAVKKIYKRRTFKALSNYILK